MNRDWLSALVHPLPSSEADVPAGWRELDYQYKAALLGYVVGGRFLHNGEWTTDRNGMCWCSPNTPDRIIVPLSAPPSLDPARATGSSAGGEPKPVPPAASLAGPTGQAAISE